MFERVKGKTLEAKRGDLVLIQRKQMPGRMKEKRQQRDLICWEVPRSEVGLKDRRRKEFYLE